MTTTRDRRSDVEQDRAESDWANLSLLGPVRGAPWWAATLVAFGVTLVAAFLGRGADGTLGFLFQAGYFLGCVAAVCWVQRRSLFGPMVQPPLIAVIVIPTVALLTSNAPDSGGMTARALLVAQPLVTAFPVMAITTAATVIVGVVRLFLQRRPAPAATPARTAKPSPRAAAEPRYDDDYDEPPVRRPARPAPESQRSGGRPPAPRQQAGRPAQPRDGGQPRGGAAGGQRGGPAGGGRPARPAQGGQPRQQPPPQRGGGTPRGGGQPRQQPPPPRRRPPRDDDY